MATDIGKAYVQIVPSAQGFSGALSGLLNGQMSNVGGQMGGNIVEGIIGSIKRLIPAAAIGKLITDSIQSGAELQQSIGGIETLFGAGGLSVEEYANKVGKSVESIQGEYDGLIAAQERMMTAANNAYASSGLSANEYMQTVTSFAASLKQSTGGDMEALTTVANQAVIDMSDNANKMGTDMQSIMNAYLGFSKQNYTMLDNLKLGYGGTKTEMQRLLKDAQKITGIKYDINNLDDVYSAIHVIQEELGITGTTASEAAGTISGSFNMLQASFSNVLANLALGESLGPSLTALVESASIFLFDNLIPAVANVITQLPGAIYTVLVQAYPTFAAHASELINTVLGYIQEQFPNVLITGLELLQNIAQGFAEGFPEMVQKVIDLIAGIAKSVWDHRDEILEIGKNIIEGLIEGLWGAAQKLWDALVNIVKAGFSKVKNWLGIESPSKRFMWIGEMTGEGLAEGLYNSEGLVRNAMDQLTAPFNSPISNSGSLALATGTSTGSFQIYFNIDNSGKDITEEDIARWSNRMTDVINSNLGRLV